ncbi:uncharacterized protein EI97DRAFT_242949 [Westerdykella ornata]|uniref:Uncharacterized protein n=1 Tax=Westerdykella ornata TaxID=318751 RepID=A0A6A6J5X2_WESOR|nr:uncharacterized protein EI97DRAFT_242949 [Westerdykella ornata]KAF2271792.1 hypothetical protein EI97DRAFT_242949 [Westerdykella ornata]
MPEILGHKQRDSAEQTSNATSGPYSGLVVGTHLPRTPLTPTEYATGHEISHMYISYSAIESSVNTNYFSFYHIIFDGRGISSSLSHSVLHLVFSLTVVNINLLQFNALNHIYYSTSFS